MAFAEARAAWQRTANRCLVQEDAKRAPKLACSSTPYTKRTESEPEPTTEPGCCQDIPSLGFFPPRHPNPSSPLSPSSRWWLHLQPNHVYQQRGLMDHQLNMETCRNATESTDDYQNDGIKDQELGDLYTTNSRSPVRPENRDEQNKLGFDPECSWIGDDKSAPWWKSDELASLVAQRSLDLIENCDLPSPQYARFCNDPYLDLDEIYALDLKPDNGYCHDLWTGRTKECSPQMHRLEGQSLSRASPIRQEMRAMDSDQGKAQILEALLHSQTRAREAESAAKRANAEKEHVVKLVFRQASQLFAYKQWFQLLQLENMYFQVKKRKSLPESTVFATSSSPWVPQRTRKARKGWPKSGKGKRGKRVRDRCDVARFAVVFALGFGLVGAGLVLGWTLGCVLPVL